MAGTIQVGGGTTPPAAAGDTVIVTTAGSTFKPKKVEIEPGDTVLWKFSGSVHNVTFKNQDKMPAGGNIPDSAPDTEASRTFENQGEYDYKCTLHKGQKGRIRVRADDD